jgi:phosphoglycerate dehydrogenase-like enzyme
VTINPLPAAPQRIFQAQGVHMLFAVLGYGRFGKAFAYLLTQAGHTVRVHDPVRAAQPGAW